MKKSVKNWVVVGAVTAVSLIAGCRNDVYVEPPPSLLGNYEGTYRYQEDNGATLLINDVQAITAIINNSFFQMYLDTAITPSDERIACDVKAYYDIEGSVTISYADSGGTSRNLTAQTCSEDRAPEGLFGLQQPADSVLLINQTTKPDGGATIIVRKIIRLKRTT